MKWLWLGLMMAGCASENYARLYHTEVKAPSFEWGNLENMEHMGPQITDRGVNFCLYSENATRIEILFFDNLAS